MKDDSLFKELYDDDDDDDDDDDNGKKKKKKPQRLHLPDKNINKLQKYYGIALRACTGRTIGEMKRDIAASLYHCCEFNTDEQRHMFSPQWCYL